MPYIEQRFIPISEACSDKIDLSRVLPNIVDSRAILVDFPVVENLVGCLGLNELNMVNWQDAPTSNKRSPRVIYSTQLAVGQLTIERTPLYAITLEEMPNPNMHFSGRIAVNTKEIGFTITRDYERWPQGSRSPEAWAFYLDNVLKDGTQSLLLSRFATEPYRLDRAFGYYITRLLSGNLIFAH